MPIASAVIGVCGASAYYLYGGANADGLATNSPKGLLWYAIQQEYERGIREFNFGGVPSGAKDPDSIDHGLYLFKRGFGGTERCCIGGRKVLRPGVFRAVSLLKDVAPLIRDRFRTHVSGA